MGLLLDIDGTVLDAGRAIDGAAEAVEELRRRATRVAVSLAESTTVWQPPGEPTIDWNGRDVVLTYLDWQEGYEDALRGDGIVRDVRHLPRDLNDVFLAAVKKQEGSCASSER